VICSDGLTGVVTDEEVAAILASTDDMSEVCRLLIEMARGGGGPDNITVIAARFDGETMPEPDSAAVKYERWMLDVPSTANGESAGGEAPASPELEAAPASEAPVEPQLTHDPARTFLSLMVLFALTLGGLVTAAQMHRTGHAVWCVVSATGGLTIRVDSRDVGLRTSDGETRLRLPPGRHRVGLRGEGAPAEERSVEVEEGSTCRVSFHAAP
jgi:hypothetical protein